ncbi:MAG: glycosyltransferase [Gammaproteobacteria bacterium]|nr:glycosyltransferase [Gammaproteobacteria bacterium]MBU1407259.1 glycosyltransferase [Gammaproteobacteria bacterium]MBU1531367.1 glycosyltransferase [Gammaproteobacteria bacterium]
MSNPLRVLHVLGELKPSGAETMLVAAAPLFQAEGVMLDVLSTGTTSGPYAKRFEDAGYRLHHIPFSRSPGFFLRVRKLIQAGDYDVLHLHTEAANFWFGLVAKSVRVPVILRTVHNAFAFTGNLQWRRGVQRRLLNRMGVRHVAISTSVHDTERRHYRLPTTLVWNWYNNLRFTETTHEARAAARKRFGVGEQDFVIASIGNCSSIKNHTAVIEAMAMLPSDARLVYLHAGIEEVGEPERELARALGVADRIHFVGGLGDVLPLLQAADAFVMPSIYEGFGIAAIEALGTGLPALFSDVAGLRDFRVDFPHLVYCGTTSEEVAVGIETLMRMPSPVRAAIRAEYPVIAQRRFGMERGVNEYLALYRPSGEQSTGAGRAAMQENHHA